MPASITKPIAKPEDEHDVDDAAQRRVGDASEDLVVVAGTVVGAQLERDDAEDDVEDARAAMPIRPFTPKERKYWSRSGRSPGRADDDSHRRRRQRGTSWT